MSNACYRILITGAESSGKSTLARALAQHFDGSYHEEAARRWLTQRGGHYTRPDLDRMLATQVRSRAYSFTDSATGYHFYDTGAETYMNWSEIKYGEISEAIRRQYQVEQYDLVLLLSPELTWEPDPLRESPKLSTRERIFSLLREMAPAQGRRVAVIKGDDFEKRLETAIKQVDSL